MQSTGLLVLLCSLALVVGCVPERPDQPAADVSDDDDVVGDDDDDVTLGGWSAERESGRVRFSPPPAPLHVPLLTPPRSASPLPTPAAPSSPRRRGCRGPC